MPLEDELMQRARRPIGHECTDMHTQLKHQSADSLQPFTLPMRGTFQSAF